MPADISFQEAFHCGRFKQAYFCFDQGWKADELTHTGRGSETKCEGKHFPYWFPTRVLF